MVANRWYVVAIPFQRIKRSHLLSAISVVTYNTSLLAPGKQGINHDISQDGRVAILTVRRRPEQPTFSELQEAWGELAALAYSWDADVRINSRRGRWELQIGGDGAPIQTMGSSNSRWRSVLTAFYRIWSLPRA
jgi:hypothetical protein